MRDGSAGDVATVIAAEALRRSNELGAIATGRYGDLTGVAGDPLRGRRGAAVGAFVMRGGETAKQGGQPLAPCESAVGWSGAPHRRGTA